MPLHLREELLGARHARAEPVVQPRRVLAFEQRVQFIARVPVLLDSLAPEAVPTPRTQRNDTSAWVQETSYRSSASWRTFATEGKIWQAGRERRGSCGL